jgi:hypothetical protein
MKLFEITDVNRVKRASLRLQQELIEIGCDARVYNDEIYGLSVEAKIGSFTAEIRFRYPKPVGGIGGATAIIVLDGFYYKTTTTNNANWDSAAVINELAADAKTLILVKTENNSNRKKQFIKPLDK